jgi:hypothetical protein
MKVPPLLQAVLLARQVRRSLVHSFLHQTGGSVNPESDLNPSSGSGLSDFPKDAADDFQRKARHSLIEGCEDAVASPTGSSAG